MERPPIKTTDISIHTLRMEGDLNTLHDPVTVMSISIHTLRMEGDPQVEYHPRHNGYFNPHPPHGG